MKKFLISILISVIFATCGMINVVISAQDYYPMACNAFEVSYINDDGSFRKVECYSDFDSAKNKMRELGGDHVVRNPNSWSPTKIIAMNSGMAYSYPSRNGVKGLTMNLYENAHKKTDKYKTTYLTNHYEMTYVDTVEIIGGGTGMIHVVMNGFDGYTDLEYTDLVPTKYIQNGIAIVLGGKQNGASVTDGEYPFTVICKQDYYEVVEKDGYRDLVFHLYRSYSKKEDHQPVHSTLTIGAAPDFMKAGKRYYSNDGLHFYEDDLLTKEAGTFINYYQFLPLRSTTNISASIMNDFLKHKGHTNGSALYNQTQAFIDGQNMYGTNALMIFAMAIHESGYGESYLSLNYNNIFGWGAYDSNVALAKKYPSIREGILAQMGDNLANYLDQAYKYHFGSCVGNKGMGFNVKYASDPYWGVKIAGIAYEIDKYASGNKGKLSDYGKYEIALVEKFDAKVRNGASDSSSVYYTSKLSDTYQPELTVIKLGEEGSYTKIQCTNPIVNGQIVHPSQITTYAEYDFNSSIAYMKTSDLYIPGVITEVETNKPEAIDETKMLVSIDGVSFENNGLKITGMGIALGHNHTAGNVRHDVEIIDLNTNETLRSIEAVTAAVPSLNFNDGRVYESVMFDATIPYDVFANGEYAFRVTVKVDNKTYGKLATSTDESVSGLEYADQNRIYTTDCNEMYSYILTLKTQNKENALAGVSKPSSRLSLLSLDDMRVDDNAHLQASGQAMIFYLNYDKVEDIAYRLHLVSNDRSYVFDCTVGDTDPFVAQVLKTKYKVDHINFDVDADISTVEAGSYCLYLEIVNGEYRDYVEFNNYSGMDYECSEGYVIGTGTIRDRLVLEVK